MKKALVMLLTLAMVMAFALPAYAAVESPASTAEDLAPIVVKIEDNEVFSVISTEEVEKLPEAKQEVFVEAKKELEATAPEGAVVKYFFYFAMNEDAPSASTNATSSTTLTLDLKSIVLGNSKASDQADVEGEEIDYAELYSKIVLMQFVDGKWVELETELDEDGNIIVKGVVDGPVAIFVKGEDVPAADLAK